MIAAAIAGPGALILMFGLYESIETSHVQNTVYVGLVFFVLAASAWGTVQMIGWAVRGFMADD